MAVKLDYDNGMLNTTSDGSHSNHGTIGDKTDTSYGPIQALATRFGFYTTSKGVGFYHVEYDYDNGMLNTTSDDVPLTLTCPY